MLNNSRLDIYNYLYNLFYDVVTKNVYSMNEPQELTTSDTQDGFIVLRVGNLIDESEFSCEAYGEARVYVEAYVPTKTRGRLDKAKYEYFEREILRVIDKASKERDGIYHIQDGSMLSMDDMEDSNANNVFYMFIRSFVVTIDEQQE